ncbi:MAG: leucine--tRNA ligase, partial [Nocardioidaceae bacterium]
MESNEQEQASYDVHAVQQKWRQVWDGLDAFRAGSAPEGTEKRYALTMFPYPSGDLHMGHAEVMALHDVIARYWWQRGYDVLNPMGWDSFGLPAENAAIRNNEHPATYTYANIDTQYESFRNYAISFDWSRRFNTSDPDYYTWTQWLFLKFRERGLAYRKNSPVNWCPNDQTVLANEQVVDGRCERCGAEVTKRELNQWYFKITDYAQELLDDLDVLAPTWPDRVVTAQRNWIGRSEGAHVTFTISSEAGPRDVEVYTTRPDTLYGATFMVVAADAPLAAELVTEAQRTAYEAYLAETRKASEIDRLSTERPKTGVDLGVTATNPVNGEQIPVWASDYVLADYGTGAIMAVPAHDQRDLDFAKAMGLPVRRVVDTGEPNPEETFVATTGDGVYVNSGSLDGLTDKAAGIHTIVERLEADGTGSGAVNFRLRDWLLSRQRYWGVPIPIIHCERDGEVPVPYDELPLELPELRGADLKPKGVSPLAAAEDWVNVVCPQCGGPAKRDSDTMDTFVDSSWYFMRYCDPHNTEAMVGEGAKYWMPVDQYIGGIEHAILHLLYARFWTKVMRDMGLVKVDEPFTKLLTQGMVLKEAFVRQSEPGGREYFWEHDLEVVRDEYQKVVSA